MKLTNYTKNKKINRSGGSTEARRRLNGPAREQNNDGYNAEAAWSRIA